MCLVEDPGLGRFRYALVKEVRMGAAPLVGLQVREEMGQCLPDAEALPKYSSPAIHRSNGQHWV